MTGVAMINHGGSCCGITHMYLGNSGPDEMQDEMKPFDYKDLVNTYGKIASFFVPDPANWLFAVHWL
jgi:hypothetical protein